MSSSSNNARRSAGRPHGVRITWALLVLALAGAMLLSKLQYGLDQAVAAIQPDAKGVENLYSVSAWHEKLVAVDASRSRIPHPYHSTNRAPIQQPAAPLSIYEIRTKASVVLGTALKREYAPLLRSLALSSTQQAKLLSVLAGKRMGLCPNEPPLTDLSTPAALRAFTAEIDDEVEKLIGPTAYPVYQQFLQTLPARNLATNLQYGIAASGNALSEQQVQQLVSIFERHELDSTGEVPPTAYPNNRAAAMGTSETVITNAMISDAAAVVNVAQLEMLKGLQRIQTEQLALDQAEARAYALQ